MQQVFKLRAHARATAARSATAGQRAGQPAAVNV
jgi:hypothetical protein